MLKDLQISPLEGSVTEQILRCLDANDGYTYFARLFAKSTSMSGTAEKISLYAPQEAYLNNVHNNQFSINVLPRQSGKEVSIAVYIVWYMTVFPGSNIVITGPKLSQAQSVIAKIKDVLVNCSSQIVRPLVRDNVNQLTLNNRSVVKSVSLSEHNLRGQAIDLLYINDASFCSDNHLDSVLKGVMPTLCQTGSKIVLTSNPGPAGCVFNNIWSNKENNSFSKFSSSWRDFPMWDNNWMRNTVKMLGQQLFNKEYECVF